MAEEEVWLTLVDVFSDVLDVDAKSVGKDTNAESIDHWDSLAHVRLVVALEEEFGLEFDPEEIVEVKDLGALLGLIVEKQR